MKDGFLYIGCSADGVVAAANKPSGPPITQDPAFMELVKQVNPTPTPGTEISGFQYANLPASVPPVYPALEKFVQQMRAMAQQQSIALPEHEHILPSLEKLVPELSPALNVSWADANGWHTRGREPFPGSSPNTSLASVGGVALGVSILLPSLNRARETANRVKCASDERQMGQACLLFCNDHQGKYPADIADMLTEAITPDVFICPSSGTSLPKDYATMAPADLAKWITDHGDYVYVGAGMTSAAGADQIVVYEKPGNHRQAGMNILFGDGHVEFDLMANAVKMIRDQHKTVAGVTLPGVSPSDAQAPGTPDNAPVTPSQTPGGPGM
jgi:prepilin-type processing-associated H-X9-DG protein